MNAYPKPSKSKKHDRLQSKNRLKLLIQLSEVLESTGVHGCEVCSLEHREGKITEINPGCRDYIDPAHRHEREDYYSYPEQLWSTNQVIMAGRWHHNKMDKDKEYRKQTFIKLRGPDLMKAANEN
jgi:hypothetical protein